MNVFYEADADPALLRSRRVVVLGWGSQGRAHALNLRDSGLENLVVALRPSSPHRAEAEAAGLAVADLAEAARGAELLMLATPDETHETIYRAVLAEALPQNAALAFAHGFAIRFGFIAPRPDLDILLVSPNGPGAAVRDAYTRGGGVACLWGLAQDATGQARALALAYGAAIGAGRAGMIETSFAEETETDLFAEQAVLCGGVPALMRAGFETLCEAGYAPEIAYLTCVHEVNLITNLVTARGLAAMRDSISNTAEFGADLAGPRLVTAETRAALRAILAEVRSGEFAALWRAEAASGMPRLHAARSAASAAPVEEAGRSLRALAARGGKSI